MATENNQKVTVAILGERINTLKESIITMDKKMEQACIEIHAIDLKIVAINGIKADVGNVEKRANKRIDRVSNRVWWVIGTIAGTFISTGVYFYRQAMIIKTTVEALIK